jgi:hypothetical protein
MTQSISSAEAWSLVAAFRARTGPTKHEHRWLSGKVRRQLAGGFSLEAVTRATEALAPFNLPDNTVVRLVDAQALTPLAVSLVMRPPPPPEVAAAIAAALAGAVAAGGTDGGEAAAQ